MALQNHSFKVPLPVKKRPIISLGTESLEDIGLPSFSKKDFSDITIIGRGSYGKVYKAIKKKKEFVIKELSVAENFPLFIKEAKMMKTVQGHENVLQIHGFSYKDKAILLDYISFSFEKIEIDQDTVFNLKEYLVTCDEIADFAGFEHTTQHLAKDILSGLNYLHGKGVAHRDLKPENVLVSNNHVATSDAEYWWSERPIVAILSDFGEARSSIIQTKILAETSTHNLFRGSPAYMAPEALLGDSSPGTIQDLLKMDIWSFGMVLFHLIYPDTANPYAEEIKENTTVRPIEALKKLVSKKALPRPSEKYSVLQNKQLKSIFYKCAKFDASCRPTAEILKNCFDIPSVELPPHVGPNTTIAKASIDELGSENIEEESLLKNSPTKFRDFVNIVEEDDDLNLASERIKDDLNLASERIEDDLNLASERIKDDLNLASERIKDDLNLASESIEDDLNLESESIEDDFNLESESIEGDFNFESESIEGDLNLESESIQDDLNLASKSIEDRVEVSNSIKKHRNKAFLPEKWSNCTVKNVAALPADIDGLVKYTITCDMNDMMKCTKDGRPWGRWVTSSRVGFHGKRRLARCNGSPVCNSETCPFRSKYGVKNRTQFQKKSSVLCCFTCGTVADWPECLAVKVWEFETDDNKVTVMHMYYHTCIVKKKKISSDIIKKEIRNNMNAKPSKMVNDKLVDLMSSDSFAWREVEEVAENFADMKRVYNARDNMKKEINPCGQNFEALAIYKQKCDERDKFFIYKVNNRALNMQPSYVFKASKAMANLCIEMDCNKDGILNEEFAFIDAKHNRCKNFKTVTLWTYHPVLRKTICLAKMEAEAESSVNLEIFWKLLNEMLEEVNNQKGYKFNPCGFIMDENSANWISVKKVFGEHILQKCASCEFHYKQSVHRHAKKVSERSADFINLAEGLLDALSISDFNVASSEIKEFIDNNAYHQQLNGWYKWWLQRKSHIFRAFKAENTPASNLAEIGHAKIASVGRAFMSLLEAAREDTALSIRQDAEIRLFDSGLSKGGKGPTSNQRKAKEYKAGIKRAKSYAAEIDLEEEPQCKSTPCFVPSKGKHRPPEKPPSKKKKPNEKPGPSQPERPLPFHVSLFGTIFNLKKCYGCQKEFKNKHKTEPNDLILKHYCYRTYKDKNGNYTVSRVLQAAYFHLKLDCTRKVVPTMEISDVIIHQEVANSLSDRHKNTLRKFGITM